MIISDIEAAVRGRESRIDACVGFESGDHSEKRVFACGLGGHELSPDANALLLCAFIPAWVNGERRIRVDGKVCPLLKSNLQVAAALMREWYRDLPEAPLIEGDEDDRQIANGAMVFLSGGVDSLATVQDLMQHLPPGHPDRPTTAVFVEFQHSPKDTTDELRLRGDRCIERCREICNDVGLDLMILRTDLRALDPDGDLWTEKWHGSFMSGVAHFLGHRFRVCYLASSRDITSVSPWGSHPALDPLFSSQHLSFIHHGFHLSRLEKTKRIASWPLARDNLYVCYQRKAFGTNCGRCEKCLRTKMHLFLVGHLHDCCAFSEDDIDPPDLKGLKFDSEGIIGYWEDIIWRLRDIGRDDLADAAEASIRRQQRWPRRFLRRIGASHSEGG